MKTKLLRMLVAVIAAALWSSGAQAAVIDWGIHDAGEFGFGIVDPGAINDFWTFSISDSLVLDSSVTVSTDLPPVFSIVGGSYALFSSGADLMIGGGDDLSLSPLGGWAFDGTTGSTQNFVNLAAGSYYFQVTGNAAGFAGGIYSVTSSIMPIMTPVPEPGTVTMLVAGLALLGFAMRRRRMA